MRGGFGSSNAGRSADRPALHFHGKGSDGEWHLPRLLPLEAAARGQRPSPLSLCFANPALPRGEPLAGRESFRLKCKVCGRAKAFPRSGEGGCDQREQTDEGAGKQPLSGNYPSSASLRSAPSPQGVKASAVAGKFPGEPQSVRFRPPAPLGGAAAAAAEGLQMEDREKIVERSG